MLLGLEDERAAFRRYKAIRQQEREYLSAEPSDLLPQGLQLPQNVV